MNPPKNIQDLVEPVKPFLKVLILHDSTALAAIVPNWESCKDSFLQRV